VEQNDRRPQRFWDPEALKAGSRIGSEKSGIARARRPLGRWSPRQDCPSHGKNLRSGRLILRITPWSHGQGLSRMFRTGGLCWNGKKVRASAKSLVVADQD